jgi:uncharacterized protein YbjQ (UPF0145 family)
MKLVPFLDSWTGSESKLDIKAIYRRPGEGVSLTGGLPVRRHSQWSAKGLRYVCLASVKDVNEAAKSLRESGHVPTDFQASFTREGGFDVDQYVRESRKDDETRLADLRAKVDKYGADAVVEMMRITDPTFELPAELLKPGESKKVEKTDPVATATKEPRK